MGSVAARVNTTTLASTVTGGVRQSMVHTELGASALTPIMAIHTVSATVMRMACQLGASWIDFDMLGLTMAFAPLIILSHTERRRSMVF